jgi:hypothetical protein
VDLRSGDAAAAAADNDDDDDDVEVAVRQVWQQHIKAAAAAASL